MRFLKVIFYCSIVLLAFGSCHLAGECELNKIWKVEQYTIQEMKCPDLVLTSYYNYEVLLNNKQLDIGADKIDSCRFTCQVKPDLFVLLNICDNSIKEIRPAKTILQTEAIDSIVIADTLSQKRVFSPKQIRQFCLDWNNSKVQDYQNHYYDSAYAIQRNYDYSIAIYVQETSIEFSGLGCIVVDHDGWKYIMDKKFDTKYLSAYWDQAGSR